MLMLEPPRIFHVLDRLDYRDEVEASCSERLGASQVSRSSQTNLAMS